MGGHHLILGELVDFLSGKKIPDTHDERYRQKIARFLVERKGFAKNRIDSQIPLVVEAGDRRGQIKVDFGIRIEGRIVMIIKYGPGSLVTRYRPALAMTRVLVPHQIPLVAVTNGEALHLLDGEKGGVLSEGFESLPDCHALEDRFKGVVFGSISKQKAQMEARVIYCYEIDGSCPCDDTVCKLP